MFHFASKILFFLLQPSTLAVVAIGAGLAGHRRYPKAAITFIWLGLAWIVIAGFLPIGNALIFPLEQRFSDRQPSLPQDAIAGIIILGGFEDGWVTAGRGGLAVNESAERLTEGVRAARVLPGAKVVFTGGVGSLFEDVDAGSSVRDYLVDAGIAADRIVVETKSRNTYENAVFTRDLLQPKPVDRWLLVTSAYHMPRAVGAFRKAGFNIVPFPVDFRTRDIGDLLQPFSSIGHGLLRADLATKEWIGLVAYWASGRSDNLFPAP